MKEVKKMENRPSFDNSFVDKTLPTTSISTILTMLQEPFDQQGVAIKTFNKRFNDPTSEYYNMTVEDIIQIVAEHFEITTSDLVKGTVKYLAPTDKKKATVTIPSTVVIDGVTYKVTAIDDYAFKNNKKLKKITIGSNIITIGKQAFYGCKNLKTVTIGKSVKTIKDKAFYKCTSLTKITIPSKVTKIGKQAFYGCKKLKKITIKTTKLKKSKVGSKAFKGTPKNVQVKVPKTKNNLYKEMLIKKGMSKNAKISK